MCTFFWYAWRNHDSHLQPSNYRVENGDTFKFLIYFCVSLHRFCTQCEWFSWIAISGVLNGRWWWFSLKMWQKYPLLLIIMVKIRSTQLQLSFYDPMLSIALSVIKKALTLLLIWCVCTSIKWNETVYRHRHEEDYVDDGMMPLVMVNGTWLVQRGFHIAQAN